MSDEKSWLAYTPIPLFASVMGITGLGLAWHKAGAIMAMPSFVHGAFTVLSVGLFVVIGVLPRFHLKAHHLGFFGPRLAF